MLRCTTRKTTPAVIEFVDIAGLVKGASRGEGLGNKFLGNIRMTDAIVHVVRCFDDDNVIHVEGSTDPVRDMDTIDLELVMADLEMVERRIDKAKKAAKGTRSSFRRPPTSRDCGTGSTTENLPAPMRTWTSPRSTQTANCCPSSR